jgi:hypothetical protein
VENAGFYAEDMIIFSFFAADSNQEIMKKKYEKNV